MDMMHDLLTNELFPQALWPVTLENGKDFDDFRRAAHALMAKQILPEQIVWGNSTKNGLNRDEFSIASAVSISPQFLTLCQTVILHKDPGRFGLLYRMLWRLVHQPTLPHEPADADLLRAQQMADEVQQDIHKMKAFMLFHTLQDEVFKSHPQDGPLHVGWFEPEHHITKAVAPFFARRFARMRWAILTPECSVEGSGAGIPGSDNVFAGLRFEPGVSKAEAPPPQASEQQWLSCYQHTFKPMRQKTARVYKKPPRRAPENSVARTQPAASRPFE